MCVQGIFVLELEVMHALSYLDYLVTNGVSHNMMVSHVSALVMTGLQFVIWDHPSVLYFQ